MVSFEHFVEYVERAGEISILEVHYDEGVEDGGRKEWRLHLVRET